MWHKCLHIFFTIFEVRYGLLTCHLMVLMGLSCASVPCDKLTVCSALQQLHHKFLIFLFVCFRVCWSTLKLCHTMLRLVRLDSSFLCSNLDFVLSPAPFSNVCMVMGLFLKPIAEGPKCFQSHVFAHICRILRWHHLVLKFEDESLFQSFLFCTYNLFYLPLTDIYIWMNLKLWFCVITNALFWCSSVAFSTFCMIFFFSLLFGFVSVVFFDHEISEFMRLGCMREKTWEMGHGLFVKWAMTWKAVKFEIKFWETQII